MMNLQIVKFFKKRSRHFASVGVMLALGFYFVFSDPMNTSWSYPLFASQKVGLDFIEKLHSKLSVPLACSQLIKSLRLKDTKVTVSDEFVFPSEFVFQGSRVLLKYPEVISEGGEELVVRFEVRVSSRKQASNAFFSNVLLSYDDQGKCEAYF